MSKRRSPSRDDAAVAPSHLERTPPRPPVEARRGTLVHIRWMINRDKPEVLAIEASSCKAPWEDDDFSRFRTNSTCVLMVAEYREQVVGFMAYELHRNRLVLVKIAVHEDWRRQRIGEQLVHKLVSRLTPTRRNRILAEVPERNLSAQLFFRELEFLAIQILRDFSEDVYLMQYRCHAGC